MTPPSRLSFARTDHHVPAPLVSTAAGTLLLVDLLRVWLPSIITIFGQAASTPAELMGAFALLWFLVPFAVVPFAARWGSGRHAAKAALAGGAGLAAARFALVFVHGGQAQLYVASIGLLAGLSWLAATAVRGGPAAVGVPVGLAAGALQHAALRTVDLTWQSRWWAAPLVAAECLVFIWYQRRTAPGRTSAAAWFLVGPAMLLAGMFALSPAIATVALSYRFDPVATTPPPAVPELLLGLAVVGFLAGATGPLRGRFERVAAALTIVAAAVIFGLSHGPGGLFVALLLGCGALGWAFRAAAADTPPEPDAGRNARSGYAALAGMLVFAVAAVAYYAAYDLGYPNQWVPVAVALAPAWILLRSGTGVPATGVPWRTGLAAVAVCLLVPLIGATTTPPVERSDATGAAGADRGLRLVAYNIRMGFGLDGTFRPAAAARAIAASDPDVVVLSEVDRAWVLNGGHDDLRTLATRLGMRYWFAPAADAVWGDAVLTNLPVAAAETVRLSAVGAPTGAQALGVVVRFGGREIAVVSTHIQPPPDAEPLVQVGEIAAFATRFGGDRPTFIAGDLNIEPGDAAMRAFADAGYTDGFAAFRPVRTFPADKPVKQIDHVLVRGLTCAEVSVGTAVTSDHAPIVTTLR
ncbi:endonuclease/exonuclease/phosphatase family protein [Dactylosporangium maewongense]|uniref:endonuclease/exonuclease/phosphatase family protein n=1 Tax=Dactylosporangium maewongense TaxID=634393 RepID=UPI0031D93F80